MLLVMCPSQILGILACLPPEAQGVTPTYTVAVDVFLFGQLSLYTLVQEFPNPSATTYVDLGVIVARTEYQRRAHYIEKLQGMLVGTSEAVVRLIQQCLENDPRQRPSTQQIVHQLKEKWVVLNDPYVEMTKLELVVSMRTTQVMYGCNVEVSMPKLGHHLSMCAWLPKLLSVVTACVGYCKFVDLSQRSCAHCQGSVIICLW